MSTSTLQYAIAGLLGIAWVWMLGRPLLISALKKSRRNSIGYYREQQAALASAGEYPEPELSFWERRPRPVSTWLDQPTEKRRLQTLLGSASATFGTLLLAIALKGIFWSLFIVAAICLAVYISFAAYVGASRLRHHEAQNRVRRQAAISAEQERRLLIAQSIVDTAPEAFEQESIFHQQSLFATVDTDKAQLDQYEADIYLPDDDFVAEEFVAEEFVAEEFVAEEFVAEEFVAEEFVAEEFVAEEFADDEFVDEPFAVGNHESDNEDNSSSTYPLAMKEVVPSEVQGPAAIDDSFFEPIPEFSVAPLDVHAVVAEMMATGNESDKFPADFAPDPTSELLIDPLDVRDRVSKPLRPKSGSRPIYIESQLDDVDNRRAVND